MRGKPVENEILVPTDHLGDFLHGLKTGAHGTIAPGMKKVFGDFYIGKGPKALKVLP